MKKAKTTDLVNRTRFSGALSNELYELFDQLHKDTRIPKNQFYDEAIELLLMKHGIELPNKK